MTKSFFINFKSESMTVAIFFLLHSFAFVKMYKYRKLKKVLNGLL